MVEARLRARRHRTQLSFPDGGLFRIAQSQDEKDTCQVALLGPATFPG